MSNLIKILVDKGHKAEPCSTNLPDGILRAVPRYGDNRRYRDKLVYAN